MSSRVRFVVLLLVLLAPSWSLAASVAEEQLVHAEDRLGDGLYLDALGLAESALRADGTLAEATFLKALAYEGLEEPRLARSQLEAYRSTGGARDVVDALARVTGSGAAEAPADWRTTFRPAQDPAPYLARADAALAAGQCGVARAATDELTWWRPDVAAHWRAAGASARCTGDARAAVLAYRRYEALGGREAEVLAVAAGLRENLASLDINVGLEAGRGEPRAELVVPGDLLQPSGAELRFEDLPAGEVLELRLGGRGLEAQVLKVEPLGPGERRVVEASLAWIGVGTLRLAEDTLPGLEAHLLEGAGERALIAGAEVEVTAGDAIVRVRSPHGTLDVALSVPDGATVDFDPAEHRPASLTVVDLPAGAAMRLYIEGNVDADADVEVATPSQVGALDAGTGVRLAPPRRFGSLPGGTGTLFVEHPTLGGGRAPVALVAGEANALAVPWKAMEGLPAVRARYEDWRARRAIAEARVGRAEGLAVLSAVLGGAAAGLLAGSAASRADALERNESLDVRFDAGECADGACSEDQAAVQRRLDAHRVLLGVGAGVGAAAGVTLVVTVGGAVQGRRALVEVGDWEPFPAP